MSGIAARIAAGEKRKRPRGPRETRKLLDATAAIIGGILRSWRSGCPAVVPQGNEELAGIPGGRPAAVAVQKLLHAGNLVHHQPGIQWSIGFGHFAGKATRLWPSSLLLEEAAAAGLTPANIREAFPAPHSTETPRPAALIKVTAIKKGKQKVAPEVSAETLGAALPALQAMVKDWNAFAASVEVTGCRPPQWQRCYKPHVKLGGRWTALENDNYQIMKKEARALIRINGEHVVEIDVKATALSIMHGLLDIPLPDTDPYDLPDAPREVVKKWVNCTLGKGSPAKHWPEDTDEDIAQYDPAAVGAVIMARYPFLADPGKHAASTADLTKLSALGKPARLLIHRLQSIEAEALTLAMTTLREHHSVLALPVHDSLIVPASAASVAATVLQAAFMAVAKVAVRVTINQAAAIR